MWEWRVWDHLVQDFDFNKPNFGAIGMHPERIDLNYDILDGVADWLHINAIDYNPRLDQIVLSVPHFDEIWIIDHSTTTEEAASSSGGSSNRGGDLLYRWGNPRAYRAGLTTEQTLFFQHDIACIDDFVSEEDPFFG
ncbi:MAG: aryl-sulfate sulfotransferase, partial [Bacteroidota bacterium]